MADRYRTTRPTARSRKPLAELKNQANTSPHTQRRAGHPKPDTSSSLPHNESLEPNGNLTVRDADRAMSPENKRLSAVTTEHARDSKRDSALSTASTTASSSQKRKCYIGHWQLGVTIGRGGCSRVRVVRHKNTGEYGAVKIVTRSTAENTRAQSLANLIESTKGSTGFSAGGYKPIPYGLEREIAVMKLLEHPNIVRLYDVWENRNELYLIMEYVDGGELFHYVDERKGLAEDETIYIFRQIVSALLYCHRMFICHRDLKPENILLNKTDLSVKLIDFGMAALQPEGRLLSTPCGSPHYAAPEVISSKPYDGTQADVWSCGVILYVMLTGTTPFNYTDDGDIRTLFKVISNANPHMPEFLSLEAHDLLNRIFVPNPKKRINMDQVWDHPLLHKYDELLGYEGESGSKEVAVGERPRLERWNVSRIQDIDRVILSNMRTLWHSESEKSLIEKLLNKEYNQEKLFYAALIKHQEEHLENYGGEADDMSHSASDYHHSRPIKPDRSRTTSDKRSQSSYSIMNDEHLRPSHSFVAPPPSESSYDPYRSSRNPIINAPGDYLRVTVHRHGTSSSRKGSKGRSLRHPNSTRIETLRSNHRRKSNTTSNTSITRSGRSRSSMLRSSMSRHSMSSTLLPSSPPVIATMRPSDVHRRGVSFGHIRRVSTASALTSQLSPNESAPVSPSLPAHLREHHAKSSARHKQIANSSPIAHADQPLKSRKERGSAPKPETPRIKVRKPETPGHHMRHDIRKHSAELEKACEEAFYRESFGSSTTARTSITDKPSPYDTPPSSIAARPSDTPELPSGKSLSRPLPDLPRDTPTSYLQRTLAETRLKLATYNRANADDNTAKFDEVMQMLDNIIPAGSSSAEKRIMSAPEASKLTDQLGFLPIISEEGSDQRSSRDGVNWNRSVTAPITGPRNPGAKTIRMVSSCSPGSVAPLNVRKRPSHGMLEDGVRKQPVAKDSGDASIVDSHEVETSALESINENSVLTTPTMVRKKRSGWFGRAKKEENLGTPTQQEKRKSVLQLNPTSAGDGSANQPPLSSRSSEFPIRKPRPANDKKGFSKWLGKMRREKAGDTNMTNEPETTMLTSNSLDSLFSAASSSDAPPAGPERSWFARFFKIQPPVQILCFSVSRSRAYRELATLFTEWQRHGIRDLTVSRQNNTITARVDKQNTLKIKPVVFRVELFIVLERGRKVGLCIARFVQVKGALSGLRQVVEVVDGVMAGRGWLVQNEDQRKALCEIVTV